MMAQYPGVFIMTFSIHIPNFVLLSQTAQLLLIFCYAAPLKGAKRVVIAGSDDKRQITALFSCTLSGRFLPPQVIYAGKTPACLPKLNSLMAGM